MTGDGVRTVDIGGGLTIAYREAGVGDPLVLLHGALSDSRDWRMQLEDLADDARVIAWDAPGCGASSDPAEGWTLDDYADAVAAFVRALDLDRPHVLGLSFGGGLAIAVAERHPELIRSLIPVSAYAGWAGSLPAEEVEARRLRAHADAARPPAEWAHEHLPGFFAGPLPDDLVDEVLAIILDARPAGMRTMADAFAVADLRPGLGAIAVPTLLVYGELDVRSPLTVADELQASIPGAQLVVIPGVGHVCNIEAPVTFAATIRRFLRSLG